MDKKEELLEKILDKLDDIKSNTSDDYPSEVVEILQEIDNCLIGDIKPIIDHKNHAWEYLLEHTDNHPTEIDLEFKGREGWELVSILPVKGHSFGVKGHYNVYFKRKTYR